MDKFFALRAREHTRYFARSRVTFTPHADLNRLLEKEVFFLTDKVVLHESQAEAVAAMTDERAEFMVIPDGMAYFDEDVTLDEGFLNTNKGDIYVDGDVTFDRSADGTMLCRMIERLIVRGKLTLYRPQEPAFRTLRSVEYGSLEVLEDEKRHRIEDLAKLRLDRQTLENYPQGVTVSDIASLTIDPDIPVELIYERLTIDDVAHIRCSTEQHSAIGAVSHDVASIVSVPAQQLRNSPQSGGLLGGLMNGLFGTPDWEDNEEHPEDAAPAQDSGVRLINADKYIL